MEKQRLKINFVLPPAPRISGGPLAILEYANRLIDRGHTVSITTLPKVFWEGNSPYPWFEFKGKIYYDQIQGTKINFQNINFKILRMVLIFLVNDIFKSRKMKSFLKNVYYARKTNDYKKFLNQIIINGSIHDFFFLVTGITDNKNSALPLFPVAYELANTQYFLNAIPDCDLNIATLWSTAFPVLFSAKGKPVYFLQHYEEIFFGTENNSLFNRLGVHITYSLPLYKVANSSWLQKQIYNKFGQLIPFSNNALVVDDFKPSQKLSEKDGIIRIVSYSRPEEWKGFGDAVTAISEIKKIYNEQIEWHVYGYLNPGLPPHNKFAPYSYHPKLSFKELAALYSTSDITLCPSWYESFPLPPLESMASGTAVITTEYGTEDYAFHNINALVVKPRDIGAMVNALKLLIADKELRHRLAAAGRQKAEEYGWDRAVDEREKILLDIHNGITGYDIYKSSELGFSDWDNTGFERAPSDINLPDMSFVKSQSGEVYLIENRQKRHIVSPRVLEELYVPASDIKEIRVLDDLTLFRIPSGSPVLSRYDIQNIIKN